MDGKESPVVEENDHPDKDKDRLGKIESPVDETPPDNDKSLGIVGAGPKEFPVVENSLPLAIIDILEELKPATSEPVNE